MQNFDLRGPDRQGCLIMILPILAHDNRGTQPCFRTDLMSQLRTFENSNSFARSRSADNAADLRFEIAIGVKFHQVLFCII